MDGKKIIERTHKVRPGETIDCEDWLDFAIVETTIRGFKVRYRQLVDIEEPTAVELPTEATT